MKAARIHAYGELGSAVVEEMPVPEVGPDEVLIRVAAASVNPLDLKLIGGGLDTYFPLAFPYALGTDLAGTVERAGPLAARWRPGDRVIARPDPVRGGAFAEFAVVPAARIAAAPATVPLTVAAGLPTTAGTAWQALFETAHLKAGQTVLIHAGAGGVGSAAVQLAQIAGAKVVTTASTANADLLRRLGATQVIDYRSEDFAAQVRDADVVLDTVGGEAQQRSFAVLRQGGVLASIVSPPDEALAQAHGVSASFVFHQTDAARLGLVAGLCDAGSLTVVVDRELSLWELAAALDHVASGHARGKVLLRLD